MSGAASGVMIAIAIAIAIAAAIVAAALPAVVAGSGGGVHGVAPACACGLVSVKQPARAPLSVAAAPTGVVKGDSYLSPQSTRGVSVAVPAASLKAAPIGAVVAPSVWGVWTVPPVQCWACVARLSCPSAVEVLAWCRAEAALHCHSTNVVLTIWCRHIDVSPAPDRAGPGGACRMSFPRGARIAKYNGQQIMVWNGTAASFDNWDEVTQEDHVKFGFASFAYPATAGQAFYLQYVAKQQGFYTAAQFTKFEEDYGKIFEFDDVPAAEKTRQRTKWTDLVAADVCTPEAHAERRRLAFTVMKQGIDTTKIPRRHFQLCYGDPAMLRQMMKFLASEVVTKGVDGLDVRTQFDTMKWPNEGNFVQQCINFDKIVTLFEQALARHDEQYECRDCDKHVKLRTLCPKALKTCFRDLRLADNYADAYQILLTEARVTDTENGVQAVLWAGEVDVAAMYVTKQAEPGKLGVNKTDPGRKKVNCVLCNEGHTIWRCPTEEAGKMTAAEKEAAVEKYFADKRATRQPGQVSAAAAAAVEEVPIFCFQQSPGLYTPATGLEKANPSINRYRFDRASSSYVND